MNKLTPMKAIRAKCLDCCNGSAKEVKHCVNQDCSLYAFRLGKNPNRKGIGCVGNILNVKNKASKVLPEEDMQEYSHSTVEIIAPQDLHSVADEQMTFLANVGSDHRIESERT